MTHVEADHPLAPDGTGALRARGKWLNKIALGCGGCLLILVTGFGAILGVIYFTRQKYQAPVEEFLASAIPVISTWEVERSDPLFAPEVLAELKKDDQRRVFQAFSRLGGLVSYDTPQFAMVVKNFDIPYSTLLIYNVSAEYDAGQATLSSS